MNDEEYLATQQRLMALATAVKDLDLYGFLRRIERAETLGPVLNPTLFILGGKRLGDVRSLAEACLVFQKEVKRQVRVGPPSAFSPSG